MNKERTAYYMDIAIAVVLGIAAVGTAWAAYQSSLWGGKQAQGYSDAAVRTAEAAVLTDEASQAWTEGNQVYIQDQQLFLEYVKAIHTDNIDLALYLREGLMTLELVAAFEWWEDQPDDGPLSPFDEANPDWTNEAWDRAAALDEEAAELLAEAASANETAVRANETSDDYSFVTVILASALFLAGIGGVFRELTIKIAMGSLGGVFLLVGLVLLSGLERA
jgi:hypothetical protein